MEWTAQRHSISSLAGDWTIRTYPDNLGALPKAQSVGGRVCAFSGRRLKSAEELLEPLKRRCAEHSPAAVEVFLEPGEEEEEEDEVEEDKVRIFVFLQRECRVLGSLRELQKGWCSCLWCLRSFSRFKRAKLQRKTQLLSNTNTEIRLF
eukprot:s1072_g17.t1